MSGDNGLFEEVTADGTQDFEAVLDTYTISGIVSGANDVMVALSGDADDSQVVSDGESYSFTVAYGGTYTVTVSNTGYSLQEIQSVGPR